MHKTGRYYVEEGPVSGYFGRNVLDLDKMRDYMSSKAYESVLASVKFGEKLDLSVADEIAAGMMKWAMEKGATHYTHWFQPLTPGQTYCLAPAEARMRVLSSRTSAA